eukprot:scaffold578261_cov35-Prasinocladus_malaysianus.AAC.1
MSLVQFIIGHGCAICVSGLEAEEADGWAELDNATRELMMEAMLEDAENEEEAEAIRSAIA